MNNRIVRLRQKVVEKGLDAILVSQSDNRRYLSGFTGSAGFLLVSTDKAVLATDFRYVEQAKAQAPDFEIVQIKGELHQWLPNLASSLGARNLGFEAGDLSVAIYHRIAEALAKEQLQLAMTESLVESLRETKAGEELASLLKAAQLADAAMGHIASAICPGMTEKEAAWEGEKFLKENGSEELPFDIIVASGPNAALPHARPGQRPIGSNEPIIVDLGARTDGYCSDLTRTFYLGDADNHFTGIYNLVLKAQLTALNTLRAGMSGEQADHLARYIIEQGGYGEAFGHGLGHGIGLATHEDPRLGPHSASILLENMVFTMEPGIYISGWGGVRIEDVVTLGKEGLRVLTKARK